MQINTRKKLRIKKLVSTDNKITEMSEEESPVVKQVNISIE
jgi:hypothetical protein